MSKFMAVGMHIYAGGFSVGMQRHLDVSCHLEELDLGVSTFRLNHPKIPVHMRPWPVPKADVLFCNPPCNSWSACSRTVFGGRDNWRTDSRTAFTHNCFKQFYKMKPRIFVWESVTRAFSLGADLIDDLSDACNAMGYSTTVFLIDLAKIGGSQSRQRMLFFAHNVELPNKKPAATAGPLPLHLLKGVEPLKHKHLLLKDDLRRLAENTEPGQKLYKTFERLTPKKEWKRELRGQREVVVGRPAFMWQLVDPQKPCPTITSMNTYVHWNRKRVLAPNEAALLMGYPEDYRFDCKPEHQLALVAKGVSPIVGEWTARRCVEALKAGKAVSKPENELVDLRK